MKKAVFMTGATGFVGSNILPRLAESPAYRGLPVFLLLRGRAGEDKLRRVLPGFPCVPVFDQGNVKEVLGNVPAHPVIDEDLVRRLLDHAIISKFGRNELTQGITT